MNPPSSPPPRSGDGEPWNAAGPSGVQLFESEEARLMAGNYVTLTNETFDEEVGASELPLIVDFWAEWCGPCRMVAPVLEQIVAENSTKIRLAKLNVDDAPAIAQRYSIMSIPTLMVFMDGVMKKKIVGAKGKGQLLEDFAEFL
jgi:thioredoxin 1